MQAIYRATDSTNADALIAEEREWQWQRLLKLRETQQLNIEKEELRSSFEVTSSAASLKYWVERSRKII
ncbi:MAG: hypothetical protein HC847_03825 [Hydrococcus sp. RU_2_2]|nr:hypothetical protein [Hydrococcus sp. RU_2_2]